MKKVGVPLLGAFSKAKRPIGPIFFRHECDTCKYEIIKRPMTEQRCRRSNSSKDRATDKVGMEALALGRVT